MTETKKSVHEALSRLTSQLVAIELKVDSNAANLGQVREKVDLVMTTISNVQEGQVQVANQLRLSLVASGVQGGDGIMGRASASTLSASMGSTPPPPPPTPPAGRIPRPAQVTSVLPHQRAPITDTVHIEADKSYGRRSWMPKMDFPRFDGTDARIWLDKFSI
jgi:hypothetical protein